MEEKKEGLRKKMSVDVHLAEVVMVGIKEDDKDSQVMSMEEFAEYLNNLIVTMETITLVGFNSNKFDIPLLINNGIKKVLAMPSRELKKAINRFNKYGSVKSIDLMEELGSYGQYKSLDEYIQIYLGVSKKEIDFETCTDEELKTHCIEDIENTYKLFNLFKETL